MSSASHSAGARLGLSVTIYAPSFVVAFAATAGCPGQAPRYRPAGGLAAISEAGGRHYGGLPLRRGNREAPGAAAQTAGRNRALAVRN